MAPAKVGHELMETFHEDVATVERMNLRLIGFMKIGLILYEVMIRENVARPVRVSEGISYRVLVP